MNPQLNPNNKLNGASVPTERTREIVIENPDNKYITIIYSYGFWWL